MRTLLIAILVVALTPVSFLRGQAPPTEPAGEVVIGSGSFSPIVKDLDKSLQFYRNLLGVSAPVAATPTPFGADPALLNFLGAPTAQVRVGTVRIPGTTMNVEIVDFKDIERKAVQPRLQDPGAVMLILLVRDIDTLFAQLKKDGVRIVTAGGAPVNVDDKTRAVVIQDPDGFHIMLLQKVEFLGFKGIERKAIDARIQDPGATRLQLRVRDSDAAVKALKAAGGQVVTTGGNGDPIDMRGLHLAIVREPNNLFLVIFAQGQRQ